jgi:hypothetical protein
MTWIYEVSTRERGSCTAFLRLRARVAEFWYWEVVADKGWADEVVMGDWFAKAKSDDA